MGLKKVLKETFENNKEITLERYRASKIMFIFFSFIFFINFYFVGAGLYSTILVNTLSYTYILELISLMFYFYFLIKKLLIDNEKKYFNYIIFIILFLIFLFFTLPVIFYGGFNYIIKLVNLYS